MTEEKEVYIVNPQDAWGMADFAGGIRENADKILKVKAPGFSGRTSIQRPPLVIEKVDGFPDGRSFRDSRWIQLRRAVDELKPGETIRVLLGEEEWKRARDAVANYARRQGHKFSTATEKSEGGTWVYFHRKTETPL